MSYQTHPAANAFPMMDDARYTELVADINANGLRVPVILCDGMVLDGRNRLKACQELGVDAKTEDYTGNPWELVWSLNGTRRDLDKMTHAMILDRILRASEDWEFEQAAVAETANAKRSEAAKERERKPDGTLAPVRVKKEHALDHDRPSRTAAAKKANVSTGTMARAQWLNSKRPDLSDKVIAGEMKATDAIREMQKSELRNKLEEAKQSISEDKARVIESVCDLRHCSCRELFASGIKPDAVITDPPYPKEFLPVFSELAEACKECGVPLVAVMSGQSYLPDVMGRLCQHLAYRWTLAYLTPGGQAVQQWQAKVNTAWKPVLLFGEAKDWFGDVATSKPNDNDKRFHGWGQSESGMADLVERLTEPGQLVCDPFLGGGTTAVVSLALSRRFVGCDVDAECIKKTQLRVEACNV